MERVVLKGDTKTLEEVLPPVGGAEAITGAKVGVGVRVGEGALVTVGEAKAVGVGTAAWTWAIGVSGSVSARLVPKN